MTDTKSPGPLDVLDMILQGAVMAATAYVAIRETVGPDQMRTVQVVVLRAAEDYCQKRAVTWAIAADICKSTYDRTRLVA